MPRLPQAETFIRVVQDQGIWWFQDGGGRRFFSFGVNCVGGCFGHAEDAPRTPSRKAWMVSLLRAWGFNTAGTWSSPSVWGALYVTDRTKLATTSSVFITFGEMGP